MKRALAQAIFHVFLWGLISSGFAQPQAQPAKPEVPPLSVQNIKGNIYQIKGGAGANTGFFIGEKEVLVIDAKMTQESARQMIAEIKKITSHPIRYVVLTHSDRDHVNGLVGFPQGIDIIAHEKTRIHMEKAFQTLPERVYLPNITFSQRLTLHLSVAPAAKTIELIYYGPAHTNGDAIVFFPDEKVAFIGDLIFIGRDMLIHRSKNGNSFGLVKVLKAILDLDAEIFIHGHGEPATKKDIEGLIRSVEEKQAKVQTFIKEGKTLDQVKGVFHVDDRASPWMSLVEVIYRELIEEKSR